MKQRIISIDVARGLAMLLVIIQHCGAFSQFILSFHMPLFFMVSGLVVSGAKPSQTFLQEIKKNAQRLLIPQLMLGLFECIFIVVSTYYYEHRLEVLEIGTIMKAVLRWWFLLVLFQCRVLLWLVRRYVFGSKVKELAVVVLLIFISLVLYYIPAHLKMLPIYMNLVPACLLFILLGYYCRDLLLKKTSIQEGVFMTLLLSVVIIVSQLNDKVLMYSYEFGNIYLFFITALAGSFFFIKLAASLNSQFLGWVGVMCMPIYVLQFHVSQYSRAIEATLLDSIGCEDIVIKTAVLIFLSLVICSLLTYFISKVSLLRLAFGLSN